jgi:hypothetical protein
MGYQFTYYDISRDRFPSYDLDAKLLLRATVNGTTLHFQLTIWIMQELSFLSKKGFLSYTPFCLEQKLNGFHIGMKEEIPL